MELRSVGDDLEEFSGTGHPESQLHGGEFILDDLEAQRDSLLLELELKELEQEQAEDADECVDHDLLIRPVANGPEGHGHGIVHLSKEPFDFVAVGVGLGHLHSGQIGTISEDEGLSKAFLVRAHGLLVETHLEIGSGAFGLEQVRGELRGDQFADLGFGVFDLCPADLVEFCQGFPQDPFETVAPSFSPWPHCR